MSGAALSEIDRDRLISRIISTDGQPVSVGCIADQLAAFGLTIVPAGARSAPHPELAETMQHAQNQADEGLFTWPQHTKLLLAEIARLRALVEPDSK